MPDAGAMVLSDYAKGVLDADDHPHADRRRHAGRHRRSWSTPRRRIRASSPARRCSRPMPRRWPVSPASASIPTTTPRRPAGACSSGVAVDAILLTRGDAGMTLFRRGGEAAPRPRRDASRLRRDRRRRHGDRDACRRRWRRPDACARRCASPTPPPGRRHQAGHRDCQSGGAQAAHSASPRGEGRDARRSGEQVAGMAASRVSRSASPMAASTFSIAATSIRSTRRRGASTGWWSASTPTPRRRG